jgi:phage terminase large subunit
MEKVSVTVPFNGWLPRPHQNKLWEYLQAGGKRAMAIWHRRAGKDEVCLHHIVCSASKRPGNYWYALPEYAQGRKAIWTAINPHTGKRRIDEVFPKEIRTGYSEAEMFIRFANSTFQIIGSDTYDSTVGASVAGIVYSEFALANPSAWAYHRPILEENNGWAAFVSTPRGRNFAYSMFQFASQSPEWFCELLTAKDTGALSDEALAETLKEYTALYGQDVGRAQYEQEYFCSFTASILGAYFALEMAQVRHEERIIEIEAEPDRHVHRAWDLGVKDDTSIWWWQMHGGQILILDHYAASGVGVEHYAEIIESKNKLHGWRDGVDWVPHDAKVKEWGSGKTRVETMEQLGLNPMLVPMASFQDGINAVRRTLPLCVFHPRCEETGISALEQYRREWDDEKKAFRQSDVHDWTAHPAAAFRYLSLAWRLAERREVVLPKPEGWTIPPPAEERGGIRL